MKYSKYAREHKEGLTRNTLAELERIAMEYSVELEDRSGIDGRGGDSVDFFEMGVIGVQRMLEAAYRLGRADGMKAKA